MTLELEEAGADVALRIQPPLECPRGFERCPPEPALLVDDLRIE